VYVLVSNSVAQCSCRLNEGVLGVLFSLAVEAVLTIIVSTFSQFGHEPWVEGTAEVVTTAPLALRRAKRRLLLLR
jgi:hypothetical protein